MDITFPEGELRGLYYLVAKDIFAFAVCFAISSLEAGAPWMKSVNSFPFSPMWGNIFAESIRCCMILPNNWCLLTVMITTPLCCFNSKLINFWSASLLSYTVHHFGFE